MPSQLAAVGEAIVDDLNRLSGRGEWPARVEARRAYLHEFELEVAGDVLLATLSPVSRTVESLTRGDDQQTLEFWLSFCKRVTDTETRTIDPLVETVELVQDAYGDEHEIEGPDGQVRALAATLEAAYDVELLKQAGLFVALLSLSVLVYPR